MVLKHGFLQQEILMIRGKNVPCSNSPLQQWKIRDVYAKKGTGPNISGNGPETWFPATGNIDEYS